MTRDIGLAGRAQLPRSVLPHHISDNARTADHDSDTRGGKSLVGIRPTIAGEEESNLLPRQQLGRLNPRSTAKGDIGILNSLELHRVRIDDQKIRTTTKARVDLRVQ